MVLPQQSLTADDAPHHNQTTPLACTAGIFLDHPTVSEKHLKLGEHIPHTHTSQPMSHQQQGLTTRNSLWHGWAHAEGPAARS
jgi:hypothetical protein